MKKIILLLFVSLLICGCGNDKEIAQDKEMKAVCVGEEKVVEEGIDVVDKTIFEFYSKNNNLVKYVTTDIYTSSNHDDYVNSLVIEYYRLLYNDSKNTPGIQYEYSDDYDNLVSTFKTTFVIGKLTYAEKDEIGYQNMLDEEGTPLSFDEVVNLFENETGIKCTIENNK